jgi:hypothetical protein
MFIETIFPENGVISLAAICGKRRIRIKDGHVTSMSHTMPQPMILQSDRSMKRTAVYDSGARLTVDITLAVGESGMVVEPYDPFTPIPIGSKIVDECTNDELLFAIQYRLGLLHGELFKHA